jgi:hypothetical protein
VVTFEEGGIHKLGQPEIELPAAQTGWMLNTTNQKMDAHQGLAFRDFQAR